jgi:hypothetical protein
MSQPSSRTTLTKSDLERIETILKKAIKNHSGKKLDQEYIDLLSMLVDTVHQLKVTVEFDHEERLRAIEDFLKES